MFAVKILADSVNSTGSRLTTFELTYPRCIHSEFMTHRMFSRNAASSRAIPVATMLQRVRDEPFVPIHWGANQKGMQAEKVLPDDAALQCEWAWLDLRDEAIATVQKLMEQGLHKQIANRLLEPWMWITVICSATNYVNFFKLRCHADAEPHIQLLAHMMRDAYDDASPTPLDDGEPHLPLVGFEGDEELSMQDRMKVSVARCARVSYLTHDGRRDVSADIRLHDRLADAGHWSPFEHVATACFGAGGSNFGKGWHQYRKRFVGECII